MRANCILAAFWWLLSTSVTAASEDYALILGDTGQVETMREETQVSAVDFAAPLRAAGFEIIQTRNRSSGNLRIAALRISTLLERSVIDRLVIVVMGPVASTERGAWALANGGSGASSLNVGVSGLPVGALSDMAAMAQGPAVILVAPGRQIDSLGMGMTSGADALSPVEEVSYALGAAHDLSAMLSDSLLVPGNAMSGIAEDWADRLTFLGAWPADQSLLGVP